MPNPTEEAPFATIFFQVFDANDDPIQGVSIVVRENQGVTDLKGNVVIALPEAPYNVTLRAYHPSYVREEAQFDGSIFSGSYNNALVQRSPGSNVGDINFTIRLGRFASAPTRVLSNEEFLTQAKKNQDVGGVLSEPIKGRQERLTYSHARMEPALVGCARATLTPSQEPDDKAVGWERFNHDTIEIDNPENHGRLFCVLSQRSSTSPAPLMLYIWSPNLISGELAKELDMVFFYHPSLAKATANYPFGVDMVPKQNLPQQGYTSVGCNYMLGSNYLQDRFGPALLYPLIARERKAIIVLPISNQGSWDPFLSQEGVWRACKEASLFLHRECRTSALYTSRLNTDKYKARAGGSLRDISLNEVRATDFGQPPRIRKIAVGFFSQGCQPAKSVMTHYSLSTALSPRAPMTSQNASGSFSVNLWGCPNLRAEDFKPVFSELWDMDGFHPTTGGWSTYLSQLDKWYHSHPDRSFHLCHSDGRQPRRPLATLAPGANKDPDDKTGLWAKLIPDPNDANNIPYKSVDPKNYTVKPIEEVHGKRWSVTALSASYLEHHAPGKGLPFQFPALVIPLKDAAHPATLKVSWGQNILLSNISKDAK